MSRRASLFSKQDPEGKKPKGVRFSDELVFLDNIKENDMVALGHMLRRASLQVDINGINDAGLTPLHQAVLDGNYNAVRLLVLHGADINKQDEDFWTPLHAACAEGHASIAEFLLQHGADKTILTDKGERPLDLVEPTDLATIKVMLENIEHHGNDESDDEDVSHATEHDTHNTDCEYLSRATEHEHFETNYSTPSLVSRHNNHETDSDESSQVVGHKQHNADYQKPSQKKNELGKERLEQEKKRRQVANGAIYAVADNRPIKKQLVTKKTYKHNAQLDGLDTCQNGNWMRASQAFECVGLISLSVAVVLTVFVRVR